MNNIIDGSLGYGWRLLVSLDQFINVLASPLLNLFLPKHPRHGRLNPFGKPDETLSSVFGKNARNGVTWCYWVCRGLHWFDKDHCKRSIEEDE